MNTDSVTDIELEARPDHSRRDVLKKGAIVGGLVWAAPAITTLDRAAAGSHNPMCTTCEGQGTGLFSTGAISIIPQGQSSGAEVCEATVDQSGVTAEAVCGSFDDTTCTANARVASFAIGSIGLSGTAVTSSAQQTSDGETCTSTGTATVGSLTFMGESVEIPAGCNAGIPLDPLLSVTFNEQTCNDDGTFTVTALHIVILSALGVPLSDIRIAQTQVRNACCAGQCTTCS